MKFQLGDHVICMVNGGGDVLITRGPETGMTGTIVALKDGRLTIGVRFDQVIQEGHTLIGRVSDGHGWWCKEDALELIETPEEADIAVDLDEVL